MQIIKEVCALHPNAVHYITACWLMFNNALYSKNSIVVTVTKYKYTCDLVQPIHYHMVKTFIFTSTLAESEGDIN